MTSPAQWWPRLRSRGPARADRTVCRRSRSVTPTVQISADALEIPPMQRGSASRAVFVNSIDARSAMKYQAIAVPLCALVVGVGAFIAGSRFAGTTGREPSQVALESRPEHETGSRAQSETSVELSDSSDGQRASLGSPNEPSAPGGSDSPEPGMSDEVRALRAKYGQCSYKELESKQKELRALLAQLAAPAFDEARMRGSYDVVGVGQKYDADSWDNSQLTQVRVPSK